MAPPSVDASRLSPEDIADLDNMNEAARKQKAAGEMKAAALAGHQPPPDPNQPPRPQVDLPPGPQSPSEINQAQLAEIERSDMARKRDMEAQMAATRAGKSPYTVGSTIEVAQSAATPAAAPGSQTAPAVSGMFEIWRAIKQNDDGDIGKMKDAKILYAGDWASLRDELKDSPDDGDWIAIHYQFLANVPSVLGFFVELDSPYAEPQDAVREKFDVIVKGKKIFRSEIEPDEVEEPLTEES